MAPRFSLDRYGSVLLVSHACQWLTIRMQFGLAHNTLDAYARALDSYFAFTGIVEDSCAKSNSADVARWINHSRACGLSDATLIQRVTAVRMFFEYLVEEGIRASNPVVRGGAIRCYGSAVFRKAGPIRRLHRLPWIPTDEEWERLLRIVSDTSLRDRTMLALAYDGALRREELCSVAVTDFDIARRLLMIRAETTKNRSGKVIPYSSVTSGLLCQYLQRRYLSCQSPGPLFLSESPRNRSAPITPYTWTKVVEGVAMRSGLPRLTTHTIRHLRLTDLARAGLDMHQIATLAGHRVLQSTLVYIHLSARDLTEAVSKAMAGLTSSRYPMLKAEEA
ncbi:MAG: tyrosine-type recombinase/integrase [Terracidiphilus sp.]